MYRIDTSNASSTLPTPEAAGPTTNGYFAEGNPSTSTPATQVKADWLNAVQEEISNVVEGTGKTLSKTTRDQLKEAINLMLQKMEPAYATASGTDTYTVTLSPTPLSYAAGMPLHIKFTNANTGAATINVNSLGAKSIKRPDGSALAANDISASHIAFLIYDGTNFILTNLAQKTTIYASVRMSANQTITGGADQKVNFDTVESDNGAYWNATNKRFNLNRKGVWRVNSSLTSTVLGSSATAGLNVYKNGSFLKRLDEDFGETGGDLGLSGSFLLESNGSDYVEIYSSAGIASYTIAGSTSQYSVFQIEFVGA